MGKHLISSPGKCLPIVLLLFRSLFYVCLNIPFIHCILKNIDTIAFDNVQEAYWSMASALSEADGIDYTDPEEVQILWTHICDLMEKLIELRLFSLFVQLPALSCLDQLELLVTTLIGLDAMDGKSSVSLLAECSSSPDVNTR